MVMVVVVVGGVSYLTACISVHEYIHPTVSRKQPLKNCQYALMAPQYQPRKGTAAKREVPVSSSG